MAAAAAAAVPDATVMASGVNNAYYAKMKTCLDIVAGYFADKGLDMSPLKVCDGGIGTPLHVASLRTGLDGRGSHASCISIFMLDLLSLSMPKVLLETSQNTTLPPAASET